MNYQATFPLLLNIAEQPTYFMALKGADGLVKMYAMVNVQQYQIVATGSTLAECEINYRTALADNKLIDNDQAEVTPSDQQEISGVLAEIRSAVMDGNSYYFLRLEGADTFYAVSAAKNPLAVILNVGDRVRVTYTAGSEGSILTAGSVTAEGKTAESVLPPAQTDVSEPDGAQTEQTPADVQAPAEAA